MTQDRTIIGIDPGTNLLGFGVIGLDSKGKPSFVDMGVIDLRKETDPYVKLGRIYREVGEICDRYNPEYMAVESPFYGKNAQVMFKLGRAQGAAIIAAVSRGVSVAEYAPRKAKIAICGNGAASKEQVAVMVGHTLGIELNAKYLDATDALALAICHCYQLAVPTPKVSSGSSWEQFIKANPDRVKK